MDGQFRDNRLACRSERAAVGSAPSQRHAPRLHVKPLTTWPGGVVALLASHALSAQPDAWRAGAACRDTDPDLFFPVGTTGPAIEQIEAAKAVCRECEAQTACLEFALATNQDTGVWGGTSEEERRKLRKQWLARQRRAS